MLSSENFAHEDLKARHYLAQMTLVSLEIFKYMNIDLFQIIIRLSKFLWHSSFIELCISYCSGVLTLRHQSQVSEQIYLKLRSNVFNDLQTYFEFLVPVQKDHMKSMFNLSVPKDCGSRLSNLDLNAAYP